MKRARPSYFAGLAAPATAAGLLLIYGCGTDNPAPTDMPGSGGSSIDGSSVGGSPAAGGALGGGGTPDPGSGGLNASGGTAPAGGSGGSSAGGASGGSGGSDGPSFVLTSPAFDNVEGCSVDTPGPCATFPDENVSYMENANVSPELEWTGVPSGTQSFALVLFDVTYGQAHWALWNIPADAVMLAADVPQDVKMPASPVGSEQANANFATTSDDGYFGPHMPCNVFDFELYALSLPTFSPENPDSAVLVHIELQELGEPVLGIAKLTGRCGDYDMTCE